MKTPKDKQQWALKQLEILRPQFLRHLLGAPEYGVTTISIFYHDGEVKRIVQRYEESVFIDNNDALFNGAEANMLAMGARNER